MAHHHRDARRDGYRVTPHPVDMAYVPQLAGLFNLSSAIQPELNDFKALLPALVPEWRESRARVVLSLLVSPIPETASAFPRRTALPRAAAVRVGSTH